MAVTIYVVTVLLLLLTYLGIKLGPWLWQVRKINKSLEVFCLTKPHWLYSHLKDHPGVDLAGMKIFSQMAAKSTGCYTFSFPLKPLLVLSHPDTVKQILKTSEPKGMLPALGLSYWTLRPWLGDGLLLSNGNKWFRNRRLLTPGFHFDILKPYVKIFNECTEKLMQRFEEKSQDGQSVEIFTPVSLCTLSCILRCTFSSEEDVQATGDQSPYVKCVQDLARYIVKRFFQPILYINQLYHMTTDGREFLKLCDYSHSVANRMIQERRESLNNNRNDHGNDCQNREKRYVDFLDILLLAKDEDGKCLTDVEIRDEVETFMFEGHDTTASGLAWCLYNLSRHPEYQAKAREEVDSVIGGHGESREYIDWEDMGKLPYLTMCIKESLRLHPPVPAVERELSKPTEINGHLVEWGTPVEISIWNVHHNSRVWGEDHMTYNPDRFLPDNMAKMHSYAFIPFSAGPRNCIGQVFAMNELKVSVARILRQFTFTVDESHEIDMISELILRPKDGIKMYFAKRNI